VTAALEEADVRKNTHAALFFPILTTSFLNALIPFITNVLLAHHAQEALKASVSTLYAIQIFHLPTVALALMAQVHVGRSVGEKKYCNIGPIIWQFIWFSLLSTIIVVPIGVILGRYYFSAIEGKELASPYYLFLLCGNFLYPLVASLSAYYLGRGHVRLVVISSLVAQGMQLLLSHLLIPTISIMAVAFSVLIAQGILCIVLFFGFLRPKKRSYYQTDNWKFRPKLFWFLTKEGYFRASGRLITLVAWAVAAQVVLAKGSQYAFLLCIGGTFYALFASFSDAMGQTQSIIVSRVLGTGDNHFVYKSLHGAFFFALASIAFMAVVLILFSDHLVCLFFPDADLSAEVTQKLLAGVWLSVSFLLINAIAQAFLWAFKEGLILFIFGLYNWIAYFLPLYIACTWLNITPDSVWLYIGLANFLSMLFPVMRVKKMLRTLDFRNF